MNRKMKKLNFTLIEVTVAFGVLAILIMFLMQFMTTAQTSWNFAEKRARAYADSRIFFDLAERVIQSNNQKEFTVNSSNDGFSVTGLKPFGAEIVVQKMDFKLSSGELKIEYEPKIEDEPIICNVVNFYVHKNETDKVIVMVVKMFGSDADYENYLVETDKDKYFGEHGFIFTRVINLNE